MINTIPGIPGISDKLDMLKLALQGLKEVGKLIFAMAKVLGLMKPDIDIQEMGDKALQAQADGITPEAFDSYSDYVAALENYEVDPERSKNISEELKEIKGIEIAIGLIVEKLADTPIVSFIECVLAAPEFFGDGKMELFSQMIREDKSFVSDFVGYITGAEKNEEKVKEVTDVLVEVEKKVYPELSEKEAYKHIVELRK